MDKRKRIITIIVLLILATVLILGLFWFLSRRTAEKNGTQPLSFRKFLGFETNSGTPGNTIGGGLDSDFTGDGQNQNGSGNGTGNENGTGGDGNTEGGSSDGTQGTNSSQFTNSTMSPDGSTNGSGTSGGNTGSGSGNGTNGTDGSGTGVGIGGGTGTGTNTNGSGTTGTSPGAGSIGGGSTSSGSDGINGADDNGASGLATTENKCSAADVNITFTPEELAQLQALQDRFYAVAQTLHTDADTDAQRANYENFKTKGQYFTQLLQYCQNTTPTTSDPVDPIYTHRVPTPFWYEPADIRDSTNIGTINPLTGQPIGTTGGVVPLGYLGIPGQIGGSIDSVYRTDLPNQGPANGLRSIEQVLRLNLW